jgi:hypothetical protein
MKPAAYVLLQSRGIEIFIKPGIKIYCTDLTAQLYLCEWSPALKLFVPQGVHSSGMWHHVTGDWPPKF